MQPSSRSPMASLDPADRRRQTRLERGLFDSQWSWSCRGGVDVIAKLDDPGRFSGMRWLWFFSLLPICWIVLSLRSSWWSASGGLPVHLKPLQLVPALAPAWISFRCVDEAGVRSVGRRCSILRLAGPRSHCCSFPCFSESPRRSHKPSVLIWSGLVWVESRWFRGNCGQLESRWRKDSSLTAEPALVPIYHHPNLALHRSGTMRESLSCIHDAMKPAAYAIIYRTALVRNIRNENFHGTASLIHHRW